MKNILSVLSILTLISTPLLGQQLKNQLIFDKSTIYGKKYYNEKLEAEIDSKFYKNLSIAGDNSKLQNSSASYKSIPESIKPALDSIIYNLPDKSKFGKIEIVDMFGRCVMISPLANDVINLSTLSSGTYLVRIKDRDNRVLSTRKILKD